MQTALVKAVWRAGEMAFAHFERGQACAAFEVVTAFLQYAQICAQKAHKAASCLFGSMNLHLLKSDWRMQGCAYCL